MHDSCTSVQPAMQCASLLHHHSLPPLEGTVRPEATMQPTKPLQRALRRLALTTKQGPHNYYKGNGTGAMGWHTKYGGYRIDYKKVRTYVCPDMEVEDVCAVHHE